MTALSRSNLSAAPWSAVLCFGLVFLLCALARPAIGIETSAREVLLMDHDTGAILLEKDADLPMPPASMSTVAKSFDSRTMVEKEVRSSAAAASSAMEVRRLQRISSEIGSKSPLVEAASMAGLVEITRGRVEAP